MTKHKLTEKRKKKYLKDSARCPFCDSENVYGDGYDYSGDEIYHSIKCLDCERKWLDIYTLTGVEDESGD